MNKDNIIDFLIKEIYSKDSHLVLSQKDIKNIANAYKKTQDKCDSYQEFLNINPEIKNLLERLQSGKMEISKQLAVDKGLQGAILTECNIAQTQARILGLEKCIDLEETPFSKVPVACIEFVKSGSEYTSAARYLYYSNKKDKSDIFIAQYGNPNAGDIAVIMNASINEEIKEPNAKAGEYDVHIDDNGALIPSDKIRKEFPPLVKYIEKFNKETNIFEHLGSNYPISDTGEFSLLSIVKEYLKVNNIDLLITVDNDELIAIKTNDIDKEINGKSIMTTKGSEIRTTGRNHGKLKAKNEFLKSIKNISNIENNICTLKKTDTPGFGYTKERGKDTYGRYKINYIFFVYVDDILDDNKDYLKFNIEKVRQCTPTISVHIQVNVNKTELKEFYNKENT